jgi:O-antigen biosynthesis protein
MNFPVNALIRIVTRQNRREAKLLRESGFFSDQYYRREVGNDNEANINHFIRAGWKAGKNPSPYFDSSHYLRTYPDVANAGWNPVIHYLMHGWKEGRAPHPDFDVQRYVREHPNVDFGKVNPLAHCVATYGVIRWDSVASEPGASLDHVTRRREQTRDRVDLNKLSLLFDGEYYESMYDDVRRFGLDPLTHYLAFGWREDRNPSPEFDTWYFLQRHPEFRRGNVSPLEQYLEAGMPAAWRFRPPNSITLDSDAKAPAAILAEIFSLKLAVHAHLFYPEYIEIVFHVLNKIRVCFDLYVTTCSIANAAFISNYLANRAPPFSYTVRCVENRGRDIGPMLTAFPELWTGYDVVAHIHSKKSTHTEYGESWFRYALEQTLGSSALVENVLAFLIKNPDVSLLYPDNYRAIKSSLAPRKNADLVASILSRAGLPAVELPGVPEVCAGSMAWFRATTYRCLASAFSSPEDFDPEKGQLDSTLAHGIEHAFVPIAEAQGRRAVCYYPRRRANIVKFKNEYSVVPPISRMAQKWLRDNPGIAAQRNIPLAPMSAIFDRRHIDIHWVIPGFEQGAGGHMTIFRFVEGLEKLGHRQTIWVQNAGGNPDDLRKNIQSWYRGISDNVVVRLLPNDTRQMSGDVIIATDCWTVYPTISAHNFKERFYFIQDFEPYFHPVGENYFVAEQTYRMGLCGLCAGDWLMERAQAYGMWARKWELAVDNEFYFPSGLRTRGAAPPRGGDFKIAFYSRGYTPRRGKMLGIAAFEELQKRGLRFKVIMFGEQPSQAKFDFTYEERGILVPEQLAAIYHECDVGVVFSGTNYSLVPLEMMACELPVLEIDTESTRAIYKHGEVTFARPNPQEIADAVHELLTDAGLREKQVASAIRFVGKLSWSESVEHVEVAIAERLLERGFVAVQPEDVRAAAVRGKPLASVVIPTFNAGARFKNVLHRLATQKTSFEYEVLIVDSGSSDETLEWVKSAKIPRRRLIQIPNEEFQHGRTRNLGIGEAEGHYVALITQDATPYDDHWLENLIRGFSLSPRVAGVIGRHKAYPEHGAFNERDLDEMCKRFAEFGPIYSLELGLPSFIHRSSTEWQMIMQFYSDNNSAIAKDVWKLLPYPEVDWGEDQIWCWEMLKAGFAKAYVNDAVVLHSHDFPPTRLYEVAMEEGRLFSSFFGWNFHEDDAAKGLAIQQANTRDAEFAAAAKIPFKLLQKRRLSNRAIVEGRARGASIGNDHAGPRRPMVDPVRPPTSTSRAAERRPLGESCSSNEPG